jgi:hypothetical protein
MVLGFAKAGRRKMSDHIKRKMLAIRLNRYCLLPDGLGHIPNYHFNTKIEKVYILNQLEKAYFQVPLNGLGFIRGARYSPLMCKGRLALEFKLSLK